MNFIGSMEDQEIQVELKYCERCGVLWLRPEGADGVYCPGCRARLEAMPNPGEAPRRKTRSRRQKRSPITEVQRDFHNPARIEYLEGVAAIVVWA